MIYERRILTLKRTKIKTENAKRQTILLQSALPLQNISQRSSMLLIGNCVEINKLIKTKKKKEKEKIRKINRVAKIQNVIL